MESGCGGQDTSFREAHRIIEDAWQELKRSPYVLHQMGVAAGHLPDLSFNEAERRSSVGRALLKSL